MTFKSKQSNNQTGPYILVILLLVAFTLSGIYSLFGDVVILKTFKSLFSHLLYCIEAWFNFFLKNTTQEYLDIIRKGIVVVIGVATVGDLSSRLLEIKKRNENEDVIEDKRELEQKKDFEHLKTFAIINVIFAIMAYMPIVIYSYFTAVLSFLFILIIIMIFFHIISQNK